jgi:hypothetical protein
VNASFSTRDDVLTRDIDRTLLRVNLALTPEQRLKKFINFMRFITELQEAGKKARQTKASNR